MLGLDRAIPAIPKVSPETAPRSSISRGRPSARLRPAVDDFDGEGAESVLSKNEYSFSGTTWSSHDLALLIFLFWLDAWWLCKVVCRGGLV